MVRGTNLRDTQKSHGGPHTLFFRLEDTRRSGYRRRDTRTRYFCKRAVCRNVAKQQMGQRNYPIRVPRYKGFTGRKVQGEMSCSENLKDGPYAKDHIPKLLTVGVHLGIRNTEQYTEAIKGER